jgi:DNA-binding LytR/AlgR family response regulator
MKKVNCIIADDEILSLDLLENYVTRLGNYSIAARCKNGMEVFHALKEQPVDLLFLDIQMPQLTGIELVKSVADIPPVIFTTAFREYAADSYDINAVDYLLKPISFERFLRAIDKFETVRVPSGEKQSRMGETPLGTSNPFIYVKSAKKTVKVFLKDIVFIEGAKQFVRIKTITGDIITYQTLQDFEQRLPDTAFLRIHRSYIIAVDHIHAYSTTSVEIGDTELPIGQSYQRGVAEALK